MKILTSESQHDLLESVNRLSFMMDSGGYQSKQEQVCGALCYFKPPAHAFTVYSVVHDGIKKINHTCMCTF